MKNHSSIIAALLLVPSMAGAQQAQSSGSHRNVPSAQAQRITDAVQLDGRLDDVAWTRATPITEFRQYDPDEGEPVSERTEVRIVYDDDALYIGARLYDRGEVRTRLGRRDMDRGDTDWLAVVLDSYHDHQTAYVFLVNPSGVVRDAVRSGNGADASWDAVWQASTAIDSEGWIAEIRIPFSQLRYGTADVQTWGMQIERDINRRGEYAIWSFSGKAETGGIPAYGHLEGLAGIPSGKRLEALPYIVAKNERIEPGSNPYRTESESAFSTGLDLKYRVTSNFTLDATVNPDFGQVEVDPAVVNLSAAETFFEEKRPFFLEGASIFGFGMNPYGPGGSYSNLFYSRRVGRSPQVGAPTSAADVPSTTTILGAAKLTGRTEKWSVGVLNALTQREEATYRPFGTLVDSSAIAEPLTNYFVGRAVRSWRGGQTRMGGILTGVNREDSDDRVMSRLRSAAYSGGLDFSHEMQERTWRLSGFLAGSQVRGDSLSIARTQRGSQRYFQRPDADHLTLETDRETLSGFAGQAQILKQSGRHWVGDVGAFAVSPGYEVNDLGFQSRADQMGVNGRVEYAENTPGRLLRRYGVWTSGFFATNFDGLAIGNNIGGGVNGQFLNFSGFSVNAGTSFGTNDDRLTRGGPLSRSTTSRNVNVHYYSDSRAMISGWVNGGFMRFESGGSFDEFSVGITVKPAPSWNFSLSPQVERILDPGQFVDVIVDPLMTQTFGRRYVFATIDQTTVSMETRLNVTFSPRLSFELFAQPFISSGDYGDLKQFSTPGEFAFDYYRDIGTVENTADGVRIDPDGPGAASAFEIDEEDFNVRSLRGNAVLRWEWRPGSTLFFAWQQSRADERALGTFDFARDRRALFRAAPDNVFLVKLNYWVNP